VNRIKPLGRNVPLLPGSSSLSRTGWTLARRSGIRRRGARESAQAAPRLRRTTTLKTASRNPNGPTGEVRELVLERDGYTCQCGCRRSIIGQRYSLGHRLRASQGGRAVASNLLTFLGWGGEACHGRIDRRDDPRDEDNGMTVRSGQDPAEVPVTVTRADGSKVERFLWDDGTRRDYSQGSVAA
jgi:hypothetical protein